MLIGNSWKNVRENFKFYFLDTLAWKKAARVFIIGLCVFLIGEYFSFADTRWILLPVLLVVLFFWPVTEAQISKNNFAESLQLLDSIQQQVFMLYLQQDYAGNAFFYEKKLHMLYKELLACSAKELDPLVELFMMLGNLRYRIDDPATLGVCSREMVALSEVLSEVFSALVKKIQHPEMEIDFFKLNTAVENFKDIYQTALQVVSAQPVCFLLFVQTVGEIKDLLIALANQGHPRANGDRPHTGMKFESFINKTRLFTYLFAFCFSTVCAFYFSRSQFFWMPLVTFAVMQTAIGIEIRQGIYRYFTILISVALANFLLLTIPYSAVAVLALGIFSLSATIRHSRLRAMFSLGFWFGIIFLIAVLFRAPTLWFAQFYDITFGAIIGILANIIIFPRRVDVKFRMEISPIFKLYSDYLVAIVNFLFREQDAGRIADEQKIKLKQKLQVCFPFWVYESGLSVAWRRGHRHFLLMFERVTQILFSLHQAARHSIDKDMLKLFYVPVMNYVEQVQFIFTALNEVLSLKQITEGISDLAEEMHAIEKTYQTVIPVSLELIDLSENYIQLMQIVQDLRDLRFALLQLAVALRAQKL